MLRANLGLLRGAIVAACFTAPSFGGAGAQSADPLPSWNDGAVKSAIVDFVGRVTKEDGPDFVPVPERIATFDNDGTLWAEQPVYFQVAFAFDRIRALAPQHPEWKDTEPYKSVLEGDDKSLAALDQKSLLQIIETTHAGMTTTDFADTVESSIK